MRKKCRLRKSKQECCAARDTFRIATPKRTCVARQPLRRKHPRQQLSCNVILIGGTGTGKSHLALALGYAALQQTYRVRFYKFNELARMLLQAQEHRYEIKNPVASHISIEFAEHEAISKSLNAQFYFAHPYASWERGLNENTNGLIRQYLKKGCAFSQVTDNDLVMIMDKLNNRPRKSLGYATQHLMSYLSKILKHKVNIKCIH